MKRREFITGMTGLTALSLAARAEQADKVYRIGFLANDPTIPSQFAGKAYARERLSMAGGERCENWL